MNEILRQLKQATNELHLDTEKYAYSEEIKSGSLTSSMYLDLILKTHYIHNSIEQKLFKNKIFRNSSFQPFYSSKLPQLKQDLLEAKIPIQNLGVVFDLEPKTIAEITGILYVVEGSALGQQVIRRLLEKNSKLWIHQPFHFFNAAKPELRIRWKAFAQLAEQHITTLTDLQSAESAALSTFRFFNEVYKGTK